MGSAHGSKGSAFQKPICNLLLGVHPICANKWAHPICTKYIHQYYLDYRTIHSEYKTKKYKRMYYIRNINLALIDSVENNNVIIVKWCLKNKANACAYDDYPLKIAIKNNYIKIVQLLLIADANIHIENSLQYATKNDYLEIVKLLLEKNATTTTKYSYDLLRNIKLIMEGLYTMCVYDLHNPKYRSAFYIARAKRYTDIMSLLTNNK